MSILRIVASLTILVLGVTPLHSEAPALDARREQFIREQRSAWMQKQVTLLEWKARSLLIARGKGASDPRGEEKLRADWDRLRPRLERLNSPESTDPSPSDLSRESDRLERMLRLLSFSSLNGQSHNPSAASRAAVPFSSALKPKLLVGGTISGTVVAAATSQPLADAFVWALPLAGGSGGSGTTDGMGAYRIEGLQPGTYVAIAWKDQFSQEQWQEIPCEPGCDFFLGTPIDVQEDQETGNINFTMSQFGAVSGTVRRASDGALLGGVTVTAELVSGWGGMSAVTGPDGTYTITGLRPDSYYIWTLNDQGYLNEAYNDIRCHYSICSPGPEWATVLVELDSEVQGINFDLILGGTIPGTVADSSSGLPIEDACIYASTGENWAGSASTGADGTYQLRGLIGGDYTVRAGHELYVDEIYDDQPCEFTPCEDVTTTPVPVLLGQEAPDIDFALDLGGTITGTIRDASTLSPLAYIYVDVLAADFNGSSSAESDSTGAYSIAGLPTGNYFAWTGNYEDYANEYYNDHRCESADNCEYWKADPIAVLQGSVTSGVDFDLLKYGSISGCIKDESTGLPVPGTWLYGERSEGYWDVYGTTDALGCYRIAGLLDGQYFIYTNSQLYLNQLWNGTACQPSCDPWTGTPVNVTLNADTPQIDFALSLGGSISGTVTAAGVPRQGVRLYAEDRDGKWAGYGDSASDGTYQLGSLPTGEYRIWTIDTNGYVDELHEDRPCDPRCVRSLGTLVPVTEGADTPGIDFDLSAGGVIEGHVFDAISLSPVPGVNVAILNAGGDSMGWGIQTGPDGSFRVQTLPPGHYWLKADHPSYVPQLYQGHEVSGTCDIPAGDPIALLEGQTMTGIDFLLEPGVGGTIRGRVTSASTGRPLCGEIVQLYAAPRGYRLEEVTSDCLGRYELHHLAPGSYNLALLTDRLYSYACQGCDPPSEELVSEIYDDLPYIGTWDPLLGTPVPVQSGQITDNIDFALETGGGIRGAVHAGGTGKPVPYALISLVDLAGGRKFDAAWTDGDGVYRMTKELPTGDYFVLTSNEEDLLDQVHPNQPCPRGICDPKIGSPVRVTAGSVTTGIDFSLEGGGSIEGTLTVVGGQTASTPVLSVFDAAGNRLAPCRRSYPQSFVCPGLATGDYHLAVDYSDIFVGELYSDLPCPLGACSVTLGTAVHVTAGSVTSGIAMDLDAGGTLRGTIRESLDNLPINNSQPRLILPDYRPVDSPMFGNSGEFAISGLPAGSYHLIADAGQLFLDELYENVPCPGMACDPEQAHPIILSPGGTVGDLDFVLDPLPDLGVAGAQEDEGNTGQTPLTFHVSLSGPRRAPVMVHYDTADLTATAGEDYLAVSGTLTLTPEVPGADVIVQLLGDAVPEPQEEFRLILSGVQGGLMCESAALGVIQNDDGAMIPEVSGTAASMKAARRGAAVDLEFEAVGAAHYNLYVSTAPPTHPFSVSDSSDGKRMCDAGPLEPAGAGRLLLRGVDLDAGITPGYVALYFLVTADNGGVTEGPLGSDSRGLSRAATGYCAR